MHIQLRKVAKLKQALYYTTQDTSSSDNDIQDFKQNYFVSSWLYDTEDW